MTDRRTLRAQGLGLVMLLFAAVPIAANPILYRMPSEVRLPVDGISPSALGTGDFTEDGILDVVVAYARCDSQKPQVDPLACPAEDRNGRVAIFLGGVPYGRSFRPAESAQRFVVGELPRSLVIGDFNNDGHLDVVVANFGSGGRGSLSILLGNGKGGFQSRRAVSLGGSPKDIEAGDFNQDGKLDVVVAFINTRRMAVLLGDGKGDFAYPDEYQTGNAPQAVAVGDFNGDSFLDVATANLSQTQSISILLNDKRGGFGAFDSARHIPIDDAPFDIVAADFNRDGYIDLATSHAAATDSVRVWLGDGQGNFTFNGLFTAGPDPIALAVADFNGDGALDVAATNGGSNSVTLLFGNGYGRLDNPVMVVNSRNIAVGGEPLGQLVERVTLPAGITPVAALAGPLNRDNLADLIISNQGSHDFSVLLSKLP